MCRRFTEALVMQCFIEQRHSQHNPLPYPTITSAPSPYRLNQAVQSTNCLNQKKIRVGLSFSFYCILFLIYPIYLCLLCLHLISYITCLPYSLSLAVHQRRSQLEGPDQDAVKTSSEPRRVLHLQSSPHRQPRPQHLRSANLHGRRVSTIREFLQQQSDAHPLKIRPGSAPGLHDLHA